MSTLKKGNQDKKSERGKYVLTAGNGMTRHEKKSKKYRKTAGRPRVISLSVCVCMCVCVQLPGCVQFFACSSIHGIL